MFYLQPTTTSTPEDAARLRENEDMLERKIDGLQSKLSSVISERDALKTSLLEAEIAGHEGDQAKSNEIETIRVEVAKLHAEIETLQVTLDVRDNEIKVKKEELRIEKVSY